MPTSTSDPYTKVISFTDFVDFNYVSPYDTLFSLPEGICDCSDGTAKKGDGLYSVSIFIIPNSKGYEEVGSYYSRIINSYIHEINKGRELKPIIVPYIIDSMKEYDTIETEINDVKEKYSVISVFYNCPSETRKRLLEDFDNDDNNILWFNLHSFPGHECEKRRYNLGFSASSLFEIDYIGFDVIKDMGDDVKVVLLYSNNSEDEKMMELLDGHLKEVLLKTTKNTIDDDYKNLDEAMTSTDKCFIILSLDLTEQIEVLKHIKTKSANIQNAVLIFVNLFEPLLLNYKDDINMMENIYSVTEFSQTEESSVMNEIKRIVKNYYKVDQDIYGFMGLVYYGLKIYYEVLKIYIIEYVINKFS